MRIYIFFISFFYQSFLFAQGGRQVPDPIVNNQFGYLNQVPLKPTGVTGSVYLNEQWKTATVNLKKGAFSVAQLPDVSVKLDLKTNTFELSTGTDIKVLDGVNVESFTWVRDGYPKEELYINCDKFTFEGTKLIGFGRLICKNDNLSLIEYQYIEFLKADYNVALDVGSKDHKYVKRNKLYLVKGSQLVSASKKSVYQTMFDKEKQVKIFIKKNALNLKQEKDLAKLVEYYNSI